MRSTLQIAGAGKAPFRLGLICPLLLLALSLALHLLPLFRPSESDPLLLRCSLALFSGGDVGGSVVAEMVRRRATKRLQARKEEKKNDRFVLETLQRFCVGHPAF